MNYYDYEKAKKIIDDNRFNIDSASLGLQEDWFWTSETIFRDGEYLINLEEENLYIAGINGSPWATPKLYIKFKDGTEQIYDCYTYFND